MRNKYNKTKQKRKTIVELSTPIFLVVRGLDGGSIGERRWGLWAVGRL